MSTQIDYQISRERAREFLTNETGGRIFTAFFVKKNGQMREMRARRGVSKGVTGNGLRYDPATKGLLTVYDMQIGQHRQINLETLVSFNIGGETFIVS